MSKRLVPLSAGGGGLPPGFKYVTAIEMDMDPETFVITTNLIDQNGGHVGPTQTIDLPFESVVVDGYYDAATKCLVLTLQSGNVISIPVDDLVDGLQETLVSGENIKTINNESILGPGNLQVSPYGIAKLI